ncbi:MAG: hypothetical protein HRU15_04525 [Planctomycetes bacterium]|nr:hypothetical protein [Planctomycetota bacterium]
MGLMIFTMHGCNSNTGRAPSQTTKDAQVHVTAKASDSESKADAAWAKGNEYLRQAIVDDHSDESKDKLLKKAYENISEACNIYRGLMKEGDKNIQAKLTECEQDKYLTKKVMQPIR